MNREFLINLVFLISINLIIKPFYLFGIDLKVQNELTNYGLYFALLNLSYILQIFTDLGIHQYNNRKVSQQQYLFEKYFPVLLMLKGFLSLGFIVLSFTVALLLGYRQQELYLFAFLVINQIFITLTFFFRSNISGLQHYRIDSCISVLDKLLMIALCIPFLWGPFQYLFDLQLFVYLQTVAFGLTTLIAFWVTKKYLKSPMRFNIKWAVFAAILKKSLPFSLVVLLMTIYTRVDAVMIERLLYDPVNNEGIIQANIYAAAYRLLDAVNMICFMFAGLLLPMFARMLKKKEDYLSLLRLSTSIMLLVTVSFSVAFCFHATSIMDLLYLEYSVSMSDVAVLLMIGFNSIGMIHIAGTFLTANGNLKQMNIVIAVGIVVNVLSNWYLIPRQGAYGAAIATLLTQSFVAMAEFYLVKSIFSLRINWLFLTTIVLFSAGVIAINYGLRYTALPWLIQFVAAGVLSVIWAFLTQFLKLKRILSIFRTKNA